jgi:hypothetical protein
MSPPSGWMLDVINQSLVAAHEQQMATYKALKEEFKDLKNIMNY